MVSVKNCNNPATIPLGEFFICAIGVAAISGALLWSMGSILCIFGWPIEDPRDCFFIGTLCGFVGSALGLMTENDSFVKDPANSHDKRAQSTA